MTVRRLPILTRRDSLNLQSVGFGSARQCESTLDTVENFERELERTDLLAGHVTQRQYARLFVLSMQNDQRDGAGDFQPDSHFTRFPQRVERPCGRRVAVRRSEEAVNIYVDRYRFAEWAPIIALLAMATIDWLWTLRHFSRGIGEANPIMAWTLAAGGTTGFSITKLGISILGCSFLLLHARFRYTRLLLPIVLAAYAYVMAIQVLTEFA